MSRRLCDHLRIEIPIRKCHATRPAKRRLDQQLVEDVAVEFEAKAEGVPGMGAGNEEGWGR